MGVGAGVNDSLSRSQQYSNPQPSQSANTRSTDNITFKEGMTNNQLQSNVKKLLDVVFIDNADMLQKNIDARVRFYDLHGVIVVRDDLKDIKGMIN